MASPRLIIVPTGYVRESQLEVISFLRALVNTAPSAVGVAFWRKREIAARKVAGKLTKEDRRKLKRLIARKEEAQRSAWRNRELPPPRV